MRSKCLGCKTHFRGNSDNKSNRSVKTVPSPFVKFFPKALPLPKCFLWPFSPDWYVHQTDLGNLLPGVLVCVYFERLYKTSKQTKQKTIPKNLKLHQVLLMAASLICSKKRGTIHSRDDDCAHQPQHQNHRHLRDGPDLGDTTVFKQKPPDTLNWSGCCFTSNNVLT